MEDGVDMESTNSLVPVVSVVTTSAPAPIPTSIESLPTTSTGPRPISTTIVQVRTTSTGPEPIPSSIAPLTTASTGPRPISTTIVHVGATSTGPASIPTSIEPLPTTSTGPRPTSSRIVQVHTTSTGSEPIASSIEPLPATSTGPRPISTMILHWPTTLTGPRPTSATIVQVRTPSTGPRPIPSSIEPLPTTSTGPRPISTTIVQVRTPSTGPRPISTTIVQVRTPSTGPRPIPSSIEPLTTTSTGPRPISTTIVQVRTPSTGPRPISTTIEHLPATSTGPRPISTTIELLPATSTGPNPIPSSIEPLTTPSTGPRPISTTIEHVPATSTGPRPISRTIVHWPTTSTGPGPRPSAPGSGPTPTSVANQPTPQNFVQVPTVFYPAMPYAPRPTGLPIGVQHSTPIYQLRMPLIPLPLGSSSTTYQAASGSSGSSGSSGTSGEFQQVTGPMILQLQVPSGPLSTNSVPLLPRSSQAQIAAQPSQATSSTQTVSASETNRTPTPSTSTVNNFSSIESAPQIASTSLASASASHSETVVIAVPNRTLSNARNFQRQGTMTSQSSLSLPSESDSDFESFDRIFDSTSDTSSTVNARVLPRAQLPREVLRVSNRINNINVNERNDERRQSAFNIENVPLLPVTQPPINPLSLMLNGARSHAAQIALDSWNDLNATPTSSTATRTSTTNAAPTLATSQFTVPQIPGFTDQQATAVIQPCYAPPITSAIPANAIPLVADGTPGSVAQSRWEALRTQPLTTLTDLSTSFVVVPNEAIETQQYRGSRVTPEALLIQVTPLVPTRNLPLTQRNLEPLLPFPRSSPTHPQAQRRQPNQYNQRNNPQQRNGRPPGSQRGGRNARQEGSGSNILRPIPPRCQRRIERMRAERENMALNRLQQINDSPRFGNPVIPLVDPIPLRPLGTIRNYRPDPTLNIGEDDTSSTRANSQNRANRRGRSRLTSLLQIPVSENEVTVPNNQRTENFAEAANSANSRPTSNQAGSDTDNMMQP